MYILTIKHSENHWLAAISQNKNSIDEYLGTLSADIRALATCNSIAFKSFPFVMIEHNEALQDSGSTFEFCSLETLQERIEKLRGQRIADEDHVYFRYYFFDEDYFQSIPNENYMRYRQHTSVTNIVLDAPYRVSVFHEKIKKYATAYDIESLDELFEQTKTIYTLPLKKEDLALNGYDSLFWDMNYDYACGKLTEAGVEYLLPMVDKMEALLAKKRWKHRSYALHIVFEKACEEKSERISTLLQETVNAFKNYLLSHPEEKPDIHRLLSLAYEWMMEADSPNAFKYWRMALSEIQEAIEHDPEKASWLTILKLLYTPLSEDENIKIAQAKAQERFIAKTNMLESKLGAVIAYRIAQAYQQLHEHWEWKKTEEAFPETEATRWAEKSLAYQPKEINRLDLNECAQFYSEIGLAKKRIDFLKKTITLYERVLAATTDCAFEIYYIANLWQKIAEIHIGNNELLEADKAVEQAQQTYGQHKEIIRRNPSTYLHYAEFLEYCLLTYPGNIKKPELSELKCIAAEVEIESEGFLSYPYLLLMKIALYENNEKQAILELTKSLILHELCADAVFDELWEKYKDSGFKQLSSFLSDILQFMKEVRANYYYHPELSWKQLQTMTSGELSAYWQKRKNEIRDRPAHHIE